MKKIILASSSTRRKTLLEQIGLRFEMMPSKIDELKVPHLAPKKITEYLARKKAQKIAEKYPTHIVIGADTIVVSNNKIVGKPKSKKEAINILNKLNGKSHYVITGLAVINNKKIITSSTTTKVQFRKLTAKEINNYVSTGEPMDKAGAYGIQEKGALLIKKIDGDYFNVVGLPIVTLYSMLKKFRVVS